MPNKRKTGHKEAQKTQRACGIVPEVVDFFRRCYGPVNRAFVSLDDSGRRALYRELELLWSAHNCAQGDFTVVEAEYLEVIAKLGEF